MRYASCHPDQQHYARELCQACYKRALRRAQGIGPAPRGLIRKRQQRRPTHRPNTPMLCPRCHQIGPRAGQRHICWTCDQALTASGLRFCQGGQHDAAQDAFTVRHGTCRACINAADRAKRSGQPVPPPQVCRICGCRGVTVPLVAIPQDAGGGHLCKLCLVEGLRRAA